MKTLRNIAIGVVLSFLLAWSASYFFVNSLLTYDEDKELGFDIYADGTEHYHRSEGWAKTKIGEHGIIGLDEALNDYTPKVAIWGNSYVEAFQVNDDEKIGARLNCYLKQNGISNLTAIQIGMSGNFMPDYCYKIPRYRKVIPSIISHYIILGSVLDFSENGKFCHISCSPNMTLAENRFRPESKKIRKILTRFRLDFIWDILKEDTLVSRLNFVPSFLRKEAARAEVSAEGKGKMRPDICSFLLDEIMARTAEPVTIILCPRIPWIENGVVNFKDPNSEDADELMRQCERRGIRFINMNDSFCNYYKQNLAFARGFPNSKPASGHMNAVGEDLVAQAIFKSISEDQKSSSSKGGT